MSQNPSVRILNDNPFRFWISLFVFAVCFLLSSQSPSIALLRVALLFFSYNVFLGLFHYLASRGKTNAAMEYLLFALDALAITGAVLLSGGFQSPLYILYVVLFGLAIYHQSLPHFVYSVVLSVALYGWVLFKGETLSTHLVLSIAGQLLTMGALTVVLYALLKTILKNNRVNARHLSRAQTLASIADVLSGSLENSRDWMRLVTKMIDDEISKDGLRCRVVIHQPNQAFLPPTGGKGGMQIPIMVGEKIFGTMLITKDRREPVTPAEADFFSSIGRSLGLSLHRSRLWEDFQAQLRKMEAELLLEKTARRESGDAPMKTDDTISQLEDMIDLVQMERGKIEISKTEIQLADLLNEIVMNRAEWGSPIEIRGRVGSIPLFFGDGPRLKKLLGNMVASYRKARPEAPRVVISVDNGEEEMTLSVFDGNPVSGGVSFDSYFGDDLILKNPRDVNANVSFLFCQKVAEAHGGRFWAERQGDMGIVRLKVTLPLIPEPKKA